MAVDWFAISQAIATVAKGITGMGETYPWEPREPSTPCAYVRWRSIPLRGDTLALGELTAQGELVLVAGELVHEEAVRTLLGWLGGGAGALWTVFEAASAVDSLVDSFTLEEAATVGLVPSLYGERDGAVIPFEVMVARG